MDDHGAKPLSAEALVTALEKANPCESGPTRGGGPAEDDALNPESDPDSDPVLDDEKFDQLCSILGAGDDGVGELVDTFLDRIPGILADLQEAADDRDADEMAKLAHKIKGESSTLGAKRLSSLAKALEDGAREGRLDDLEAAVERIEEAYRATETAFLDRLDD